MRDFGICFVETDFAALGLWRSLKVGGSSAGQFPPLGTRGGGGIFRTILPRMTSAGMLVYLANDAAYRDSVSGWCHPTAYPQVIWVPALAMVFRI
jgi:hypothetical protein